MIARIWTFY